MDNLSSKLPFMTCSESWMRHAVNVIFMNNHLILKWDNGRENC